MKQRDLVKKLEESGFVFERHGGICCKGVKVHETGLSNIHIKSK
jgi:hypothetical protein